MENKSFAAAFEKLNRTDASILKEVISRKCKWGNVKKANGEFQLFYAKKRGDRPITDRSEKGVNEIAVIESVFRSFKLDAWTGNEITD